MNKSFRLILVLVTITFLSILFSTSHVHALSVGSTVSSIKIKDANDNPAWIPDIGKKVMTIFYVDPDVADVTDPLADALKAKKFDKTKYTGMGITNLKDTWKPNAIIRIIIRKKIKKYNSIILTDTDKTVVKKWNLGNCNGYSVFIIIGKDKKF